MNLLLLALAQGEVQMEKRWLSFLMEPSLSFILLLSQEHPVYSLQPKARRYDSQPK